MIMTRYKVVIKGGFSCMVGQNEHYYFHSSPNHYRLFYKDGEIVEASSNSLGIMCFDALKNAVPFVEKYLLFKRLNPEIKEIETLDKEFIPKIISHSVGEAELNIFYKWYDHTGNCVNNYPSIYAKPIKGTICCYKIKVIKTIQTFED